jgi:solute carrier family 35, member F1/2
MAPPDSSDHGGGARREVLLGLALGQLVSLLITSTGFSSSELARRGWFTSHDRFSCRK